jgi:hypothetical protein
VNAVEKSRKKLHAALVAGLNGKLDESRVTDYSATAAPTPRVYIGSPRLRQSSIGDRNGTLWTFATFPVVIDVDGADIAQLRELDELLARVWDAGLKVGQPTSSNPTTTDAVGGGVPITRRQTVDIDIPTGQLTLCPPTTEDSP